jgi:transposase
MARIARPIILTEEEHSSLELLTRRVRSARPLALRARIVLECAKGRSNLEVSHKLHVHEQTVGHWRKRFLKKRVDGLLDEPRPGAPRKMSDEQVEKVVVAALESTPEGATHWSTRLMARRLGLNQTAVSRIWRAFGLQPHRQETFVLSKDPLLVEKVRDIVGIYMNPPLNALVLCVDEKSQIQALSRSQPLLPMRPGQRQIKRGSHDSVRALVTAIKSFIEVNNQNPHPFQWVKSADDILRSIARFASSTIQAHSSTNQ